MKKLLSVIVTVAMLISCIAPSMVSFAADEPALVAADVSFDPVIVGRGNTVDAAVSVTNNPGISYAVLYIYYDNTQLEIADGAISSLVGDDYSLVTAYNLNSTDRANKKIFEAAGITTGANIKFATVTLEGSVDTTSEELVNIAFDVVADVAEGDTFTYGVFAAEAIENANYDAVVAQYSSDTATLTAAADPNGPVYEDKHFDDVTIYADTVTVNKGVATVEVGIGIDGHGDIIDKYGFNTIQYWVVFPKELKLVSTRLGSVYETADGIDASLVHNFADESYVVDAALVNALEQSGYDYENSDDNVVIAVFDSDKDEYNGDGLYYQNKERGYLVYATFEVPADKVGTYDIKVVADAASGFFASAYEVVDGAPTAPAPTVIPFALENGAIKVVVGNCDHADEYLETTSEASTCEVAGWEKTVCTNCGEVVSEKELPLADHTPGEKNITKEPTLTEEGAYEIACTACGKVVESGVIPTIDDIYFTIGSGSAKYGDEVILPITVTNNKSGMFIAALDVTFDASKLTFKGYEGGDIVAADYVNATQYEDGKVRAYFENNEELANIVGDGVIIYLVFEVANDETLTGAEIEVAVSAEADNVIDADGVALATVFENGSVKVEAREATITVGNVEAAFGKEALVPVTIKNNPGIFIGIFEVSYDASVLEYVGFDASTEVFNNADYIYATKTEDGKVTLYFENGADANATANGLLGNLKFKVADDAALVGTAIEVAIASNADDVLNYEGKNADHVLENGSVTVADRDKLYIIDTEAKYGSDCVSVNLNMDTVKNGAFIVIADIKYDTSVMTFDMCYGKGSENTIVNEYEPGTIRVYFEADGNADCYEHTTLAGLWFTVADDAELVGTTSAVTVELVEAINYAAEDVDLATVDGTVTIVDREKISVNDAEGEVAHDVKVPVSVSNNVGIWGAIVEYTFDASVLEFVGVESGLFETVAGESYSVNGNVITVFVENADVNADVLANDVLYTLVFKAVAEGTATVDAAIVEIINANGEDMTDFVTAAGAVTVVACDHSEEQITATVTKQPTIDEEGEITYTCDICGNVVKTEPIAKLAKIVIGSADIAAGDEVSIPVELVDNKGVWSIGLEIVYDAEQLEFIGVEGGLFAAVINENVSVKDGVITIFVDAADFNDVTEDGAVLTLKFKAPYTASGEVALEGTLIADNTITANEELVDYTVLSGTVTIEAHEHTTVVDEAVDATCYSTGLTEGSHCEVCGEVFVAQVEIPVLVHSTDAEYIVHVEAKDATCYEDGNVEYWYCTMCEVFWQDEALTQVTNAKRVVIPAAHGDLVHFDAVEPGCHYDGNIEYWVCYDCECVWADEALTQLTNIKNVVLPATGEGDLVHFEAVEPGCHYDGNIEYWVCYDCEQVWVDEALTQLTNIKNVVLPAVGSDNMAHFDAVEPDCYNNGNIEYWVCYDCECVWADEALTQLTNIKNVVLPALGHDMVYTGEVVEPTCTDDGYAEGGYCTRCDYTEDNVVLPALGHDEIIDAAIEATCTKNGLTEGKHCDRCGLTLVEQIIVPAKGHTETVDAAVDATCWSTGLTEGTSCEVCGVVLVAQEVLPKLEHKAVVDAAVDATCWSTGLTEGSHCEVCGHVIVAQTVVAKAEHNVVVDEAVEATCTTTGLTEGSHCDVCGHVIVAQTVIPALGHDIVYVEANAPTCYEEGNIEHWYCKVCECFWQDEALTQVTNSKNVIIPVTHAGLVHFDAVEPGCHYDGNIEYWYCADCECFWQDELLRQITNAKNVVLPAVGSENVQHVEAKAPTCYEEGNIEYWYCADCEQFWQDEALTQLTNSKNVIIGATHANVVHFDAVEPGCHYDGNIEYWYCADCEGFWQDELLREVTNSKNVVLPALGSENVQHVEAKDPTCYADGNIEYWTCADCEKVWQDEALTQLTNIKNVVVGATGEHVWADDFTVDREPADGVDGEKSKHCTNEGCDARTEITPIPATYTQTVNGVETEVATGEKVTITASKVTIDGLSGYAFDYWVVESENVTLDLDATTLENSYTMPSEDVVINSVTYLIGDCDGNGVVAGTDLIVLSSAIKNGDAYSKYLDINNDGIVAATDIIVLNQIIKGDYDYSDYLN